MSGNEILTPIKGHYSVTNLRKMTENNTNPDLVNINDYKLFGKIMTICSQDIERNPNSDINQGP